MSAKTHAPTADALPAMTTRGPWEEDAPSPGTGPPIPWNDNPLAAVSASAPASGDPPMRAAAHGVPTAATGPRVPSGQRGRLGGP